MSNRSVARTFAVIVLIVIIVAAGVGLVGLYYGGFIGKTSTVSQTSSNTLVVEEGEQPDSMDPAVEFTTAGNEITSNVYQGLVAPYMSSNSQYVGVLAEGWTISSDQMTWTFSLRQGVKFSNGDPFNAYVMWYSLYRTLVMNQAPAFILAQNFANTTLTNFNVTASLLNSINYKNPSNPNLNTMENPLQSFQVVNQYEIALNLGYGYNGNVSYSALLATLTAPCSFAVDPSVVSAHGGVVAGQKNTWMETNAVGTGFYLLNSWVSGQSAKLVIKSNYWGSSVPSSQLNYAIQPANLTNIIIYYKPTSSRIADLKSGFAQILGATDVSEISSLSAVRGIPNVNITTLPIQYGSAVASYFVFMNPSLDPAFNNALLREAVSNAINYNGIIQAVFSGFAQTWIGPVPPGFLFYNQTTSGFSHYSYNATKAAELLAQAGYQAKLPDETIINPSAPKFPTLSFLYCSDLVSESEAAPIIVDELNTIGLSATLVSMTFDQYTAYLFSQSGSSTGPGFGMSYYSEDYFASQDFVTALAQNNYTGAPVLLTNESTFAANANGALNNNTLIQAYRNVTTSMLNSYNDVWLYVPLQLAVNSDNVVGMVPNPTGSCAGYFMFYNTVHYASPP